MERARTGTWPDEAGPGDYFGSVGYQRGDDLVFEGYKYLDALTIQHEETGIKMHSLAYDLRDNCQPGEGLRDGDKVVFHYTDERSFKLITSSREGELRATFEVDANCKDSYFGHGIYATQFAPHQWPTKDHLLVNNYWPAKTVFRKEFGEHQPFPDDSNIDALVSGKGPALDRIHRIFGAKWQCCVPLIVDRHVSKNAMTEPTDALSMPPDKHGKRKKRLAGHNRFGERQPRWRDIWVVSVYDCEERFVMLPFVPVSVVSFSQEQDSSHSRHFLRVGLRFACCRTSP